MKTPTAKEIEKEIATLKDMAPRIRQEDAFGGDNRAKIEAQIEALDDLMSENECDDKEESGDWDSDVASEARAAVQWMDGEEDKPSDGWKSLLLK